MQAASTNELYRILTDLMPGAAIEIRDDTHKHLDHNDDVGHHGGHWYVTVVWAGFEPMSRLERHRFVHAAVDALWQDRRIHSLSLRLKEK